MLPICPGEQFSAYLIPVQHCSFASGEWSLPMSHPTFFVLGAQKAGTTWIADMVRQHPEVCMPEKKELHFFNKKERYAKGLEWYEQFYADCDAPVRGEATPNYLWTSRDPEEIHESGRTENVPELVHDAYPDLLFIVSLRNPVDRAVSAYKTMIRAGRVSPRKDILDVTHRHGIISMGDYQKHIQRWFDYFPPSHFLFLIFEENVKESRRETVRNIFQFLGVDPSFKPDGIDVRKHPALGSFYRQLLYYAPWLRTIADTVAPNLNRNRIPFRDLLNREDVSGQEREALARHFEGKNQELEELIGRSLPWEVA